jgi:PAS domain S-box-containing protein
VSFSRRQKRQGGIANYLLTLHNVDEREQMEQALRTSEAKYRMLAENVDDFIWILDDKLERYTYVNPAVTGLLGYTPAEMMNKSPADIAPPSQADQTTQVIQKRLAAEAAGRGDDETRRWDGRYLHKDGELVWIEAVTRPLRDKDGRFAGLIGVSRNISERKQMEQALRESERRYKEAERVAHLGSWEMEIATGKAYWSDEFFRICGYEPGSVEPSSEAGFTIIHPDDRERAAQAVNNALETGEPYNIEKRIVRPDGSIRWVHSLGEVIYDETQNPVKLTGSFLDITERKEAEHALQVSEARFRRIFEDNPLGIVLVSSESQRILQVNGRFCAMSGYTESELLALSVMDITHPDDLEKESRLIVRVEKDDLRSFAVEKRYVKKNGDVWWGKLTGTRIPDAAGAGPVGLGIVEDVTERKRIEAEREQLVQELQAALVQVRQLKSLLPICSACKKIRDDDGYWSEVEVYIRRYTGVDFSHGMCPDCMREYYPPEQFPGLYEEEAEVEA